MLAVILTPFAPRIARAEQPVVDEAVQRVMDEHPNEAHPLIVVVGICRAPIDLEPLLPTPEETNECTARWRAWERLVARRDDGENGLDEDIDVAEQEARTTEAFLVEKQQAAYRAYEEDYLEVVSDSVPLVYAELQAALSEKVRRSSTRSKLLSLTVTRDELEQALTVEGIERVCLGIDVAPSLEWSHKNVRADLIHAGSGGVGPYTGSGVKVMIADLGFKEHDRLPTPAAANRMDFTDAPCDITEGCCTAAHGNMVTGVVFCQPGEDDFVGVAYEATPVWAKVFRLNGGNCGSAELSPWTEFCVPAFDWGTSAGPTAPGAKVINFSARGDGYDEYDVEADTNHDSITALNIDWVVYARGATFVHACGNTGEESDPEGRIQPPSGAYNCLSVGGYDDGDDDDRTANVVWEGTSRGTTDDGRRKPDLCAPCVGITSTNHNNGFSQTQNGTSYAAPHVTGTCALLLEARPSLTPRQMHAILVNSTDHASHLPPPNDDDPQTDWHIQAGWGMLDAYRAVAHRNHTLDDSLAGDTHEFYEIDRPDPGEEIVITCAWQRAMSDETTPIAGEFPNLNIKLQRRPIEGGSWEDEGASSNSDVDNVEQIRSAQPGSGQQYDYRVRVRRVDTISAIAAQAFTLASRQAFAE